MFVFIVTSNDLQRIKKTIDNIYIEKQKIEKEKSKKGAGGKGKGKAKLRMEGDNVRKIYYKFGCAETNSIYLRLTF